MSVTTQAVLSSGAAATAVFDEYESSVRIYCRRFPVVFDRAAGSVMWDEDGARYLDLVSGAGALNYGHNHPLITEQLVRYLTSGRVVHGLDMHTVAKREFISAFVDTALAPHGWRYRLQFPGPTGSNAVEAALKIARRATGRSSVVAFTNAFHGMSLGALAATGSAPKRAGAGVTLPDVTRLPYDGYPGTGADSTVLLEALLDDPGSGVELPAAIVLECVQGEGGLRAAGAAWLHRVQDLARRRGIVLVVDDVQAGCGRTGTYFSFETAGLYPDVVCLSKSLSGSGQPMSLVLVRPELDLQNPGEHTGTFRGNNLGFVGATAALSLWQQPDFVAGVADRVRQVDGRLRALAGEPGTDRPELRGRGLMRGLAWKDRRTAGLVAQEAFRLGVLVETCGPYGEVLKLMPALTMTSDLLDEAFDRLGAAIATAEPAS